MYNKIHDLIKHLHAFLGCPMAPEDASGQKPPYPFFFCKVTTIVTKGRDYSLTDQVVPSASESFAHDVAVTREEQNHVTLSVNTYSTSALEAAQLAMKAADWFSFAGYFQLKQLDVVTVGVSAINERTVQPAKDNESHYGFDVQLRMYREITKRLETIESYDFTKKARASNEVK